MRQIRRGVFETNSSSTHSLTMCLKSVYDEWKSGKRIMYEDTIYTEEEIEELKKKDKYFWEDDVHTYEEYWDSDLERYEGTFTTPSGEVVVAFGLFGRDG